MTDIAAHREATGLTLTPASSLPAGCADDMSKRRSRRRRIAIVSTYHELCGVAAYTRRLEQRLRDSFDVTVFDLDQFLLRSRHQRLRRLGDRHIKHICREIAGFDAVNLQLEYGLLGRRPADISRRFRWLVAAAPDITVTFHSLQGSTVFDQAGLAHALLRVNLRKAVEQWLAFRRQHYLDNGILHRLRRAQRRKPVRVIVHNRRDRRQMTYIHRVKKVYDHPLAYLTSAEAAAIRAAATRRCFPLLDRLPGDSVVIGVFGFLSQYKGFETAIRAMQYLPEHYHLLVFGAIHPNAIVARRPIDPYLSSLLTEAYFDESLAERLGSAVPGLALTVDSEVKDLLVRHPKELSRRLQFMGAMADVEFLAAMAICDSVVFPYLEVGQSSSGPMSQALELGCRIIASRSRTFLEFARYHPNRVEFFDIGNHLELAQRLQAPPQFDTRAYLPAYTVDTGTALYCATLGGANFDALPLDNRRAPLAVRDGRR